jgi:hypothetical protein
MKHLFCRIVFLFLLLAAGAGVTGCASTESDNASARPWNSPNRWESGLPGVMNEGR